MWPRWTVELGGQAFVAAQIRENGCRRGVSGDWQASTTAINVAEAFNRAKILIQTARFRVNLGTSRLHQSRDEKIPRKPIFLIRTHV